MKVKVGPNTYLVDLALSQADMKQGLSGRKSLPDSKGMLFLFDEPQERISFWMKDTLIPLDIIMIDALGRVADVYKGEPNSEESLIGTGIKFVLEVNQGSGIKKGDVFEIIADSLDKMRVLDENGEVQFKLKGGERIVSRKQTKVLIKKAKKAKKEKTDAAYSSLARYMFGILEGQDTQEQEYVEFDRNA